MGGVIGLLVVLVWGVPVAAQDAAAVFEGDVGPFHVVATSGDVNASAGRVMLDGEVAIYPNARPDLRITLSGGTVELIARSGADRAAGEQRSRPRRGRARRAGKRAASDAVRREIAALERRFADDGKLTPGDRDRLGAARAQLAALAAELAAMHGQDHRADQFDAITARGTLAATLAGVALRIPGVSLSLAPDATLAFRGGDTALKGCTHTAGSGSRVAGTGLLLSGTLRCGSVSITSSLIELTPSEVKGSGLATIAGYGYAFGYSLGAQLTASGMWRGVSPGFQRVPGFDALEFEARSPSLRVVIEGATQTWHYDASKIVLRTRSARPTGEPWAKAEFDPDVLVTPAAAPIPIPFPNLPDPGAPLRGARDACLADATQVADAAGTPKVNEREAAIAACHRANPRPPAIPKLPAQVSVPIDKLIK